MDYQTILLDRDGDVATLTLNRPQALNALTTELLDELIHALDRLTVEAPRAVVVTGAGRSFSSGADLASRGDVSDAGARLESHFNPVIEKMLALPCPLITAVSGAAAGAGCSLALSADFVIASRSSYFLQAFINIGLVPDAGATWLLPRLAGRARATQMMMLGERIPAAQALDWGMIYQVVEDDALATAARALAERLAKGPTKAYTLIRQGLRGAMESTLTQALAIERANQREAGYTADVMEGIGAFLEKRPAKFTGR